MEEPRPVTHARDLLLPVATYPQMPAWATLREAMVKLTLEPLGQPLEERRRRVLVFDQDHRLLGVLTQKGLLRALDPRLLASPWQGAPPAWADLLTPELRQRLEQPVQGEITPVGPPVTPEEDLLRAGQLMLETHTDLLPVMDKGQLLGVLRLEDIYQEVSRAVLLGLSRRDGDADGV